MANTDMKYVFYIICNQKNANSHTRHYTVARVTSNKVTNIKC